MDIEKSHDEQVYRDDALREKEELNKSHDSHENEPITEPERPDKCERCGSYFGLEVRGLDYGETLKFGCAWKVLKVNGKYLCPHCIVREFWLAGKTSIIIEEVKSGD